MLSAILLCAFAADKSLHFGLVAIAANRPTALAFAPGQNDRLYVVESYGYIRVAVNGSFDPTPFLDVDAKVTDAIAEAGCLGLAFAPDYSTSGFFYVHYIDNKNGNVVAQFNSRAKKRHKPQILLRSQALGTTHYGGKLAFGADGLLHGAFGDGTDKPAAQDLDSWRGKLIRFSAEGPEIAAYGLRNPFSWSFDSETGDLWIGDAGNSVREEIDYVAYGDTALHNFGWPLREGNWCNPCLPLTGDTPPVYVYPHGANTFEGNCIIGGYVYRGTAIPWLYGQYVFGDFSGKLWARAGDGTVIDLKEIATFDSTLNAVCGFAEDNDGELYVLEFAQPPSTADIFKLMPSN